MPKLVIFPAIDDARLRRVQDIDPRLSIVNCRDAQEALLEIRNAEAFFGKLTPALLQAAAELRWVQSPTASLEHYVFPELVEHPCQLTNMRGIFSDVIADHVMGLVLCFARNFPQYIRQQMEGRWAPVGDAGMVTDFISAPGRVSPVDLAHQHLADLTMGVVGVGHIGSEVCRRAAGFGMKVQGIDPVTTEIPGLGIRVESMAGLERLLATSDYVVIAAPHTPETERLFRRHLFQLMKPTARLINIGRGAIVDLTDLTAALGAGEIAGAALDVCEVEPLPADHPLWSMPNVIITPHVAAASPRIAERHLEILLENLRRFLASKTLLTPVDKRKWY